MTPALDLTRRISLSIYVGCFLIGAGVHAVDFLQRGLRPYAGTGPMVLEVFWTSLIILDLLIVALILSGRRRAGLVFAAVVMIADVGANAFAMLGLGIPGFYVPLLLQTLFLGFILGSIGFLWPRG